MIRPAFQPTPKVGDIVRYIQFGYEPKVESNIALIIEELVWPNVNVMWDDGDLCVHDSHDFEVISEN